MHRKKVREKERERERERDRQREKERLVCIIFEGGRETKLPNHQS